MKKILVIDKKESIEYVKKILEKGNGDQYTVTGTPFESEALQILKKEFPFDLILLDNKNPNISSEFYKTLLKKISIPVVLISSLDHVEDILSILKEGCVGYIKKPLNPERFINRLKEMLSEIEKNSKIK
jgi:two-component system cell cycle response regulator DivK